MFGSIIKMCVHGIYLNPKLLKFQTPSHNSIIYNENYKFVIMFHVLLIIGGSS